MAIEAAKDSRDAALLSKPSIFFSAARAPCR